MSHTKFLLLRLIRLNVFTWGVGLYGVIVGACTLICFASYALYISPKQVLADVLHSIVYQEITTLRIGQLTAMLSKKFLVALGLVLYIFTFGLATYIAYMVAALVVLPEALWLDALPVRRMVYSFFPSKVHLVKLNFALRVLFFKTK